jgi:hypothetical protein
MLSGWWFCCHLEKYEFVNGKDGNPIYEMENKIHVPNHQRSSTFGVICGDICYSNVGIKIYYDLLTFTY